MDHPRPPIVLPNWSLATFEPIVLSKSCFSSNVNPTHYPDFGRHGVWVDDDGDTHSIKNNHSIPFYSTSGSLSYPKILHPSTSLDTFATSLPCHPCFNWNLLSRLEHGFVCCRGSRRCIEFLTFEEVGNVHVHEGDEEVAKQDNQSLLSSCSKRVTHGFKLDLIRDPDPDDFIVDIIPWKQSSCYVNTLSKAHLVKVVGKEVKDIACFNALDFGHSSLGEDDLIFKTLTPNPFIDSELVTCISTTSVMNDDTTDTLSLNASFPCKQSICLIDVNRKMCKFSMKLDCIESSEKPVASCYASQDHPRNVLLCNSNSFWLLDSRNPCYSNRSPILIASHEDRHLYSFEKFQGSIQFPLRPQQHLIASNYHLFLVDERFPQRILMQWSHCMDTDVGKNVNFLKCHDKSMTKRSNNYPPNSPEKEEEEFEPSVSDSCCLVYMSNTCSVCLLSLDSLKGQVNREESGRRSREQAVVQPYSLHAPLHVFHLKEFVKKHSFPAFDMRLQNNEDMQRNDDSDEEDKESVTSHSSVYEIPKEGIKFSSSCVPRPFDARFCCLTGLDVFPSESSSLFSFSMIGLTKRGDIMIQDFLEK